MSWGVRWKIAIAYDFDSHYKNSTLKVIDRPSFLKDNEILDARWIFKIKTDSKGNNVGYKVRLCVRGC